MNFHTLYINLYKSRDDENENETQEKLTEVRQLRAKREPKNINFAKRRLQNKDNYVRDTSSYVAKLRGLRDIVSASDAAITELQRTNETDRIEFISETLEMLDPDWFLFGSGENLENHVNNCVSLWEIVNGYDQGTMDNKDVMIEYLSNVTNLMENVSLVTRDVLDTDITDSKSWIEDLKTYAEETQKDYKLASSIVGESELRHKIREIKTAFDRRQVKISSQLEKSIHSDQRDVDARFETVARQFITDSLDARAKELSHALESHVSRVVVLWTFHTINHLVALNRAIDMTMSWNDIYTGLESDEEQAVTLSKDIITFRSHLFAAVAFITSMSSYYSERIHHVFEEWGVKKEQIIDQMTVLKTQNLGVDTTFQSLFNDLEEIASKVSQLREDRRGLSLDKTTQGVVWDHLKSALKSSVAIIVRQGLPFDKEYRASLGIKIESHDKKLKYNAFKGLSVVVTSTLFERTRKILASRNSRMTQVTSKLNALTKGVLSRVNSNQYSIQNAYYNNRDYSPMENNMLFMMLSHPDLVASFQNYWRYKHTKMVSDYDLIMGLSGVEDFSYSASIEEAKKFLSAALSRSRSKHSQIASLIKELSESLKETTLFERKLVEYSLVDTDIINTHFWRRLAADVCEKTLYDTPRSSTDTMALDLSELCTRYDSAFEEYAETWAVVIGDGKPVQEMTTKPVVNFFERFSKATAKTVADKNSCSVTEHSKVIKEAFEAKIRDFVNITKKVRQLVEVTIAMAHKAIDLCASGTSVQPFALSKIKSMVSEEIRQGYLEESIPLSSIKNMFRIGSCGILWSEDVMVDATLLKHIASEETKMEKDWTMERLAENVLNELKQVNAKLIKIVEDNTKSDLTSKEAASYCSRTPRVVNKALKNRLERKGDVFVLNSQVVGAFAKKSFAIQWLLSSQNGQFRSITQFAIDIAVHSKNFKSYFETLPLEPSFLAILSGRLSDTQAGAFRRRLETAEAISMFSCREDSLAFNIMTTKQSMDEYYLSNQLYTLFDAEDTEDIIRMPFGDFEEASDDFETTRGRDEIRGLNSDNPTAEETSDEIETLLFSTITRPFGRAHKCSSKISKGAFLRRFEPYVPILNTTFFDHLAYISSYRDVKIRGSRGLGDVFEE